MKKYCYAIISMVFIALASCDGADINPSTSDETYVSFDFHLGASTRAAGDGWEDFYFGILHGDLIEPDFTLLFTPVDKASSSFVITGEWGPKNKFPVRPGKYRVTGYSLTSSKGYIKPLCSINIDDFVEIRSNQEKLIFTATYGSFLMFAPSNGIKKIENHSILNTEAFFTYKDYFYAFCNGKLYEQNMSDYINDYNYIRLFTSNGCYTDIPTYPMTFEIGKYYRFSGSGASFWLQPMTEGQ
jgi:hypothetical protein